MSGYNDMIDAAQAALQQGDVGRASAILDQLRPKQFYVQAASIYGHKARKPFVELRVHGMLGLVPGEDAFILTQWSPADARKHALLVLEAAEASEQDAFFISYVTDRVGAGLTEASNLLQEFRAFRAAQREQS